METTKKKNVIVAALIICLAGVLGLFVACSSPQTTPNDQETKEQTELATTQTVVDDAGREVTLPAAHLLETIYYTGSPGQIFCFTLAPELAGGSAIEFNETDLEYLPAGTGDLPYLGTLSGGKELNPEAIMAANIQVIFSVSTQKPGEKDVSDANDLQNMTNIPIVVLDGSLENSGTTYRKLGEILGKEAEAERLATYCETILKDVEKAVATIPESERIGVYYAEGPEGLQTEPEESSHAISFKIAGAKNVADVGATPGKGMSPVSLEQVLAWNPEVIIAWDDVLRGGADELIRTNSNWSTIKAVQNGRVYTMPNVPFAWCDRPPSVNRFLGIQWIAHTLYPDVYDIDMAATTKEFYKTFYHCDLTDAQVEKLLEGSI